MKRKIDLTDGSRVIHDRLGFGIVTKKIPAGFRRPDPSYIFVNFANDSVLGRFVNPEALRQAHPQ